MIQQLLPWTAESKGIENGARRTGLENTSKGWFKKVCSRVTDAAKARTSEKGS
jgi:hypothetical protein